MLSFLYSCRYSIFISLVLISILTVNIQPIACQVVINELMSSNSKILKDADGKFSDWIELYNQSDSSINLKGFGLSDKRNKLSKWRFPDINIHADSYLIIRASGKDKIDKDSITHTNFKISSNGEFLFLTSPDNIILDSIKTVIMTNNTSFGRSEINREKWILFQTPTPGKPNISLNALQKPSFSHKSGQYNDSINLEIVSEDISSTILYTIDGSEPRLENIDGNGKEYLVSYYIPKIIDSSLNIGRRNRTYIYNKPIQITSRLSDSNDFANIISSYRGAPNRTLWKKPNFNIYKSNIIRAVCYKDNEYSNIESATYFVDSINRTKFTLPFVSIICNPEDLFSYEKGLFVPGKLYYDGQKKSKHAINEGNFNSRKEVFAHADFFDSIGNLVLSQNLGLKVHGGVSRHAAPFKSFRLYARNKYDENEFINHLVFGNEKFNNGLQIDQFKQLLFRAGGHQMNIISDAIAHKIMEPSCIDVQKSKPVNCLINGEYWGIYNVRNRFDEHFISQKYNIKKHNNIIILDSPKGKGTLSSVKEGTKNDFVLFRNMHKFIVDNNMSDANNYNEAQKMIDILSYIDHNIMFIYLYNTDWYGGKHVKWWRVRDTSNKPYQDGKWRLMVYDFDLSASNPKGDYLYSFINPTGKKDSTIGIDTIYQAGNPSYTALLRSLLSNSTFKNMFINRFADHINTTFDTIRTDKIIVDYYNLVATELDNIKERWSLDMGINETTLKKWNSFLRSRPKFQREHLRKHFDVGNDVNVKLEISDLMNGTIRINSILLDEEHFNLQNSSHSWSGIYFDKTEISIEAVPKQGFKFSHWEGSTRTNKSLINLIPKNGTSLKAVFIKE